jgi:DNA-binding FadR family transcriptional regulator
MSRLNEDALHSLIEEIVEGDPPPGEMLPKEVDLAARFGFSRAVARECIRGLEERGLVAVKHGRGATVCDRLDWNVLDPQVLAALLAVPGGKQLRAEALECQRLFELEAAALAAQRADRTDIEDLSGSVAEMGAAASRSTRSELAAERYRAANIEFHRAVVRAAHNRPLARLSEPLHRALAAAGGETGDRKRRLAEHKQILAAIAAGDPDAAREAMTQHLAPGRRPPSG